MVFHPILPEYLLKNTGSLNYVPHLKNMVYLRKGALGKHLPRNTDHRLLATLHSPKTHFLKNMEYLQLDLETFAKVLPHPEVFRRASPQLTRVLLKDPPNSEPVLFQPVMVLPLQGTLILIPKNLKPFLKLMDLQDGKTYRTAMKCQVPEVYLKSMVYLPVALQRKRPVLLRRHILLLLPGLLFDS